MYILSKAESIFVSYYYICSFGEHFIKFVG